MCEALERRHAHALREKLPPLLRLQDALAIAEFVHDASNAASEPRADTVSAASGAALPQGIVEFPSARGATSELWDAHVELPAADGHAEKCSPNLDASEGGRQAEGWGLAGAGGGLAAAGGGRAGAGARLAVAQDLTAAHPPRGSACVLVGTGSAAAETGSAAAAESHIGKEPRFEATLGGGDGGDDGGWASSSSEEEPSGGSPGVVSSVRSGAEQQAAARTQLAGLHAACAELARAKVARQGLMAGDTARRI